MSDSSEGLKSLGSGTTDYPTDYAPQVLERFRNAYPPRGEKEGYTIELVAPEFTSLCPKTKQPDFAKITIDYVADEWCVESKSLKLYLFSFRNHGAFHEEVVNMIGRDLVKLLDPVRLTVRGDFNARGGISINPQFEHRR